MQTHSRVRRAHQFQVRDQRRYYLIRPTLALALADGAGEAVAPPAQDLVLNEEQRCLRRGHSTRRVVHPYLRPIEGGGRGIGGKLLGGLWRHEAGRGARATARLINGALVLLSGEHGVRGGSGALLVAPLLLGAVMRGARGVNFGA